MSRPTAAADWSDADSLDGVRERIDAIDREIHRLLNERAACAMKVAEIKQAEPGDEAAGVLPAGARGADPRAGQGREPGPLSDTDVARLFREIISCCLNLEQPLTIAYLGPPGTYTEAAAVTQFGHFARTRARRLHRRGVPRGGIGSRALRCRADREQHRGHGEPHARLLHGLARAGLRRGRAADPPCVHGERAAHRASRSPRSSPTRSRSRSAAPGSMRTIPACSARP